MIPDLQASLLCDDVRQERSGKFILIGLFDAIGVPDVPVVVPRICVVNRWCCGEGAFEQHSRILRPDSNSVMAEGKAVKVNLPGEQATATSIEVFVNVRFEVEGTYWVEILLEGDLKLRYPLQVRKSRARQGAT